MARPEDARWAAPAAWLAAALTFLSKGLIAILLPTLWVTGLAILFPKLRRGARASSSRPSGSSGLRRRRAVVPRHAEAPAGFFPCLLL